MDTCSELLVCLFVFFFFLKGAFFIHNKPFAHRTDQACSYIWPNTWPIFSFTLGQYDGYFTLNSSFRGRGGGGKGLQGNRWFSPPASMTSRLASVTSKMASKEFIVETNKSFKYSNLSRKYCSSDFLDFEILTSLLS